MTSKERQLVKDMKSWPQGLKEVYAVSARISRQLMYENGVTSSEAQGTMIEFMAEYEMDMKMGRYTTVKNAMIQTFDN